MVSSIEDILKIEGKDLDYKKFLKYFFLAFLCVFITTFVILTITLHWKAGLIIGAVFGGLFGLFAAGHMERNMQVSSFEINAQNKKQELGLSEYEDEIKSYLTVMRYELYKEEGEKTFYRPRPRLRVMGGDVVILRNPYYIEVEAPIGVVRILQSQLDLEKIFI